MTALMCHLLGHRFLTFPAPDTFAPTDLCSRCWRADYLGSQS